MLKKGLLRVAYDRRGKRARVLGRAGCEVFWSPGASGFPGQDFRPAPASHTHGLAPPRRQELRMPRPALSVKPH